jgi:hypothetical protein
MLVSSHRGGGHGRKLTKDKGDSYEEGFRKDAHNYSVFLEATKKSTRNIIVVSR